MKITVEQLKLAGMEPESRGIGAELMTRLKMVGDENITSDKAYQEIVIDPEMLGLVPHV